MQDRDFGNQNRVLTSWKEIAAYLGKGVRTVQRWEKDFGLPVRRPTGSEKTAILARTSDLDAWVALRCSTRTASDEVTTGDQRTMSVRNAVAAGLTTAMMLRETHAALLAEIREALDDLSREIARMRAGSAVPRTSLQRDAIRTASQNLTAAGAA